MSLLDNVNQNPQLLNRDVRRELFRSLAVQIQQIADRQHAPSIRENYLQYVNEMREMGEMALT
jgi:hypothetical protein